MSAYVQKPEVAGGPPIRQQPAKATIGPLKSPTSRTTVKQHTRNKKTTVRTHTRAIKSSAGARRPAGTEFGNALHRQFLNPKQIKEGKENGLTIHSSGTVFYHDPERNDFYVHPTKAGDHIKTVRSKSGIHRAYLKDNSKRAINSIVKNWPTPHSAE